MTIDPHPEPDPWNRRQHPRNQVDCLVHLRPVTAPADAEPLPPAFCIAQDVSATGLRIWADRAYVPGTQAILTFGCAKVGLPDELSCVLTIAWADPEPVEGRWQIGARFGDDDQARRIAHAMTQGCLWCEKLTPGLG